MRYVRVVLLGLLALIAFVATNSAEASPGTTERVSVGSAGNQASDDRWGPGVVTAQAETCGPPAVGCEAMLSETATPGPLTASAAITIDFNDLTPGTVVSNQYSSASFASNPGYVNAVRNEFPHLGNGNYLCTQSDLGALDCAHDTYVAVTAPVNNLTFYAVGDNDPGVQALVDVYTTAGYSATVPVIVDGSFDTPDLVDLRSYSSVTQVIIHSITDGGGLGWDIFSFDCPDGSCVTPPRKLVYIQGIHSQSACPEGAGFLDRGPSWVTPYVESQADQTRLVDFQGAAFYSYAGETCPTTGLPKYEQDDTCGRGSLLGIPGLALDLKDLIDQQGTKVTVVAHSMGGIITSYLVGSDPAWAQEHIASVVTFDSPLRGLPTLNALALMSRVLGPCRLLDPTIVDMTAPIPCLINPVVVTACGAASLVPFYTIDATDALVVQSVPPRRTQLTGERDHLTVLATHTSVWNDPADNKKRFVWCAVIVAPDCDALFARDAVASPR